MMSIRMIMKQNSLKWHLHLQHHFLLMTSFRFIPCFCNSWWCWFYCSWSFWCFWWYDKKRFYELIITAQGLNCVVTVGYGKWVWANLLVRVGNWVILVLVLCFVFCVFILFFILFLFRFVLFCFLFLFCFVLFIFCFCCCCCCCCCCCFRLMAVERINILIAQKVKQLAKSLAEQTEKHNISSVFILATHS